MHRAISSLLLPRQRPTVFRHLPISSPLHPFWFCTNEHPDDSKQEQPDSLSLRVERLIKGDSVVSAFQSWMNEGYPIQRGDIENAMRKMRNLGLKKKALEVMEWVIRERPYKPKELDYCYLLEFTIKHHGVSLGETLFSRIPTEFQNELLYNSFVIACLDRKKIRLSLTYMQQMRVLGHQISHPIFNRFIMFHSTDKRKKKIPKILTQMKVDGLPPHISTYNILLKIEATQHDVQRFVPVLDKMKRVKVEPNEITFCILATAHAVARLYVVAETYVEALEKSMTVKNSAPLNVLLMLYGYLGKEVELERTWKAVQNLAHLRYSSFAVAIEAFGRLGRVERAEALWVQLKSITEIKSAEQFNFIISVYCQHGLIGKATEVLKEMKSKGYTPNALTYRLLTLCCLKEGLTKEAMEAHKSGMIQAVTRSVTRSMQWLETTLSIVDIFADKGDVKSSKKFFADLVQAKYSRYTFVQNSFIKTFVKARVYEPDLLKKMILGGARPDAETYSLVKLVEEFKT